ncbi:sensor histidine kinase [Streptomyces viridochromogenes]|uniref:histidine kinase n=1 Tax=Streptomyces viridochromogenes Tue57 TaxID=1160705 RepID=L8P3M7_STRVR|nr:histidine kinase [Streptomyces viridochromogenes]ELS50774.1 putative two component sensor kinase [Streptomyces viridochromogenes Tue57]
MRSASPQGCIRGFGVGALLAASAVDLAYADSMGFGVAPVAVVLAAGLAAVLWPARWRPRWLTVPVRTTVPALGTLLYCAGALLTEGRAPFGPGEAIVLLCLLFVAVRHAPPRWAPVCAFLAAGALLTLPVRAFGPGAEESLALLLVGLVLVGLVGGLAGYLRSMDYRRTVAVGETRRAERLAIAADLHDFVAHHVTGILVQTQMARMMAASRPDELDPVLAGIERAATQALASMRRTVGVLRETGEGEPAERRPVGDLVGIEDLVAGFTGPHHKVTLRRAPTVSDDLPHEIQAAAFRVVQEALTNVRRHAADATEITVGLRQDADRLEVSVTDDGRGRHPAPGRRPRWWLRPGRAEGTGDRPGR